MLEIGSPMKRGLSTLAAFFAFLMLSTSARALDTVTFDAPCRVEGLSRPFRQTIIVIDQLAIEPRQTNDIGDANRRWINKILAIAGVQDGQSSVISAPREHLSIVLAKLDGGDLVRVFNGCPPTYSATELTELRKTNSGVTGQVERFFGKDVDNKIDIEKKAFRSKVTVAMAELAKLEKDRAKDGLRSSFLEALPNLSSAIDLNEGVPRIVVISPMNLSFLKDVSDVKSARALGFEMASKLNVDLQRSEIYLTGIAPESSSFVKEFSLAFFLGSRGRVAGSSGETLPAMSEAPARLRVFSGFIDYVGIKVPMQLRLSSDNSGSLVNSWIEVSVKRPVATPLTGKIVCKRDDQESCEIKGDGKEFAQSWSVNVGQEPKFEETLPFSGVRYFEIATDKAGLKGRVYDPLVVINGKKDLPFDLSSTPAVRF
jgi:hypothetical protein